MKITINKREIEEAKVGDFLLINDEGSDTLIRQIIGVSGKYHALDIEDGTLGFMAKTVKDLVNDYNNNFDCVTVVKNSEVELIVGGR